MGNGRDGSLNDNLIKAALQSPPQQRQQGPVFMQPMLMTDPAAGFAALVDAGVITPEQAFDAIFKEKRPTEFAPSLRQLHALALSSQTMEMLEKTNDQQKIMLKKGYVQRKIEQPNQSAAETVEAQTAPGEIEIPDVELSGETEAVSEENSNVVELIKS